MTSAYWNGFQGPVTFPSGYAFMDSGTHRTNGDMAKMISLSTVTAPVEVEVDIGSSDDYGECFSFSLFASSTSEISKCSSSGNTLSMSVGWGPPRGINTCCGGSVSGCGHSNPFSYNVVEPSTSMTYGRHKEKIAVTSSTVTFSIDVNDGNGFQQIRQGTGSFTGRTGYIGFGDHCVRGVKVYSVTVDGATSSASSSSSVSDRRRRRSTSSGLCNDRSSPGYPLDTQQYSQSSCESFLATAFAAGGVCEAGRGFYGYNGNNECYCCTNIETVDTNTCCGGYTTYQISSYDA